MAGWRSATRLRKALNRGASQACAAGLYDSTKGSFSERLGETGHTPSISGGTGE